MDLRILFENADMVAVEKPQGMPAQPDRTGDGDLLSLLSAQMKQELGLVHRLDRPVGGIMVFAKTKQAEAALSKMMQAGGWKKSYLTVLWGMLEEKSGTWTDYLLQPMRGIGNMALWSWKLEGKWEKQKDGFSIRSLPSDMPFSLFSEKLGEL